MARWSPPTLQRSVRRRYSQGQLFGSFFQGAGFTDVSLTAGFTFDPGDARRHHLLRAGDTAGGLTTERTGRDGD